MYNSKNGPAKAGLAGPPAPPLYCEKLLCPPVRQCTDDDPVGETIVCCPKCTRSKFCDSLAFPITSLLSYAAITNTIEATDTTDSTYTPPPLEPTLPTSKPCSVVVRSYKVYETIDKRIDQIAIESIHIANVDVYVWSNGTRMAQHEPYSSRVFTEIYIDVRFRYIGNTRQGNNNADIKYVKYSLNLYNT